MKKIEIVKINSGYKAFTNDITCYFEDFKDLKTRVVDIFIPSAIRTNFIYHDFEDFQDYLREMFKSAKNVRAIQRKINSFYQLVNL